jgi:hypothetical protein
MLQGTQGKGYYKTDPINQKYYTGKGYTPEQVEAMKDPVILAAWQKGVKDWLDKWER